VFQCAAAPLPWWLTLILYRTDKPTKQDVLVQRGIYDTLDRGECYYVVVYENDEPSELLFVGWSFD